MGENYSVIDSVRDWKLNKRTSNPFNKYTGYLKYFIYFCDYLAIKRKNVIWHKTEDCHTKWIWQMYKALFVFCLWNSEMWRQLEMWNKKGTRKVSKTRNMMKINYMYVWKCDSDFYFVLLISGNKKKKVTWEFYLKWDVWNNIIKIYKCN